MKRYLISLFALLMVVAANAADNFALLESYPVDGTKLKTLSGATFKWKFSDDVRKVIFYVFNTTLNEQITMKMIDSSTPTKEMTYYFDPSVGDQSIYAMHSSHNFEVRWTAYYSYNSMRSNVVAGEGSIKMKGDDPKAPIISPDVMFESVTPSESSLVISDNGSADHTDITLSFSGTVGSVEAWTVFKQSDVKKLDASIKDAKNVVVSLNHAYGGSGSYTVFVRAKDTAGHIIGSKTQNVSPVNGSLQFTYLSEIGLPSPKLAEASEGVSQLTKLTFTYSIGVSLNLNNGAGWKDIVIKDASGNVVVGDVKSEQFVLSGKSMVLNLVSPITKNGKYTVVLPYASFVLGQEYSSYMNKSTTYEVVVDGTNGIETVNGDEQKSQRMFDLSGRPVNSVPNHGVVIRNGVKVAR